MNIARTPRLDRAIRFVSRLYLSPGLLWAIVLLGAALRLRAYAAGVSLWKDEASLALNIIHRPLGQLLATPLEYDQAAPPIFLALEWLAVTVAGPGELALRFWPLVFGLGALPLTAWLARRELSAWAAPLALFGVATCENLVRYSAELKQYSLDVLVVLALLALTAWARQGGWSTRHRVVWAVAGALSLWASNAAAFVVAGLGLVQVGEALWRRQWRTLGALALVGALWAASFAAYYLLCVAPMGLTEETYLVAVWRDAGAFPPPKPAEWAEWLFKRLLDLVRDPLQIDYRHVAGLLIVLGMAAWAQRAGRALWNWVAFAPLVLAASALHRYPFGVRFMLFAAPLLWFSLAEGIVAVAQRARRWGPLLAVFLAVLLLWEPLDEAAGRVMSPRADEHLRPNLVFLAEHHQPQDWIYVYYGAERAMTYYQERFHFPEERIVWGVSSRGVPEGYIADLQQLRGRGRVWVVMSHYYGGDDKKEETLFARELGAMGQLLDARVGSDQAVYLYNIP